MIDGTRRMGWSAAKPIESACCSPIISSHRGRRFARCGRGNPVRHGRAVRARDRPYSSFRRWVRLGIYPENWADDPGPLTGDVIRAGSFASVNELVRDINAYLARRNADPKPYVWRAQGADILAKINRVRAALDNAPAA